MIQLDFTKLEKKVFKKNDYLICSGDYVDYVYYIVSGTVRAIFAGESGLEFLNRYRNSEKGGIEIWLGFGMMFQNNGISDMNIVAETDCICYKIDKETAIAYMKEHPDILLELYKEMCEQYVIRGNRLELRQVNRTDCMVCNFLLEHAENKNGCLKVDKNMSNQKIADWLGIHPVTVSRILSALRKKGVIERSQKGITILQKEFLMDYAAGVEKLNYREKN